MSPAQHLHDYMTALTHSPLRAEFLAAEAVNADASVDVWLLFPHRYRLCRANLRALSAADAGIRIKLRKRRQYPRGNEVRHLAGNAIAKDLKEHS